MEHEILKIACSGLPVNPLPENKGRTLSKPHAANKKLNLSLSEKRVKSSMSIKVSCL